MDEFRWVVDQVRVGIEMPGDISTIHPNLVRASNGDLLLFGNTYAGNRFRAKSYENVQSRSADNGQSWSSPTRFIIEPLVAGRRICLGSGATLRSGRIIFIGHFGSTESTPTETTEHPTGQVSPYGLAVVETRGRYQVSGEFRALLSDDDGESWRITEPIEVMDYVAGGGVTQMSDGSLVLPVYGYRDGAPDGEQFSNGFVVSRDQGQTWSQPTIVAPWDQRLHDMPNEMAIVELPDGRWIALYRNQFSRDDHNSTGIFVYRSYSYDKGKTWSVGQQIFPNMGYTSATLLPDGALLLVGGSGEGLLYAVSNDGGETWDYQNRLWGLDRRAGGDLGGFGMLALDDGRLLIAYYAKADRSQRLDNAYEYGKMRLEVAFFKKVKADSIEGRMR